MKNCWPEWYCWVCIQTKWKDAAWTCYKNLANGVSQRKTRSQQSISNRYSEKHLTSDCVRGCSRQWLQCAKDVCLLHGIDTFQFVTSINDLLIHGRGKNRNFIIPGPANCTKIFMLKPLELIFTDSIFKKPANDKYTWVGSKKAKVLLLNDFRWSKDVIPWHDILLFLEAKL